MKALSANSDISRMKASSLKRNQAARLIGTRHRTNGQNFSLRRRALDLNQIMVPIGFASPNIKALQYAVVLAEDYHASLVLFHAADRLSSGRQLRECVLKLKALARQEVCGRVPVTTLVKVGDPLSEIVDLARNVHIDLLLISTRGRAGLPDFCIDSAAEQIVRHAPCPVLILREEVADI